MRRALLLVWLAACGGDDGEASPDGRADARAPSDGRPDVVPPLDGPRPDSRLDARLADGPLADAGPDEGLLFLTDTAGARIYVLTLAGGVITSFASPVTQPTGIAFDRRARDGVWLIGNGNTTVFTKVDFSGMAVDTTSNFFGVSGANARGLDYWQGATAADDLLTLVHLNSTPVEALSGVQVTSGDGQFQSGFVEGSTFQTGFWGVAMVDFADPEPIRRWVSRGAGTATDALQRWNVASLETSISISVTEPRGLARAEGGDFYVVDAATDRVVHLGPSGAFLDQFDTPGADPAGISYASATP